ncbi:MAG: type II toxin-antitoxin system RelE/ParE family toxin [Rhodospirillales bacterium]|nr:type II toxin-antitoxin system RelE/ParE family toxin [Rhodospirillales bacterium]
MPYGALAYTERALDFLEGLPPKIKKQLTKRVKNLLNDPFPPASKRLAKVKTPEGDPVYRERSGDYRILYIVRSKPDEILILDIGHRLGNLPQGQNQDLIRRRHAEGNRPRRHHGESA